MLLSLFITVVFVAINALVVLVVVVDIFGHENFSHALCYSLPLYVWNFVVIVSFAWGKQFNLSLPLKFCDLFLWRFAK